MRHGAAWAVPGTYHGGGALMGPRRPLGRPPGVGRPKIKRSFVGLFCCCEREKKKAKSGRGGAGRQHSARVHE